MNSNLRSLLIFSLPALSAIKFNLFGEIFATELIFFIFLLSKISYGKIYVNKKIKTTLLFLVSWLFSQIITDIYVDSDFSDSAKGAFKILFFALNIIAISYFLLNESDVVVWICGLFFAGAARAIDSYGWSDLMHYWKFGVGSFFYVVGMLFLAARRDSVLIIYRSQFFWGICVGVVSFMLNARSFAGICIFVSFLTVIRSFVSSGNAKNAKLFIYLSAFVLFFAIIAAYAFLAHSGYLGDEARMKYVMQVGENGGVADVIFGGRPEILVSIEAIKDSLFLGHGSWARSYYYFDMLITNQYLMSGIDTNVGYSYSAELGGLIPSHSYLFGSWVDSGVFGGIFWIFVIVGVVGYGFGNSWDYGGRYFGVVSFLCVSFVWAIFFSPFGGGARFYAASMIVAIYFFGNVCSSKFK